MSSIWLPYAPTTTSPAFTCPARFTLLPTRYANAPAFKMALAVTVMSPSPKSPSNVQFPDSSFPTSMNVEATNPPTFTRAPSPKSTPDLFSR